MRDQSRRRNSPALLEPLEARQLLAATLRVYLTGNSMTDAVRYNGLTAFLGRDGTPVALGRQTGPGYPQAYNYNLIPGYFTSGSDPARPTMIDPWGTYQKAFGNTWDDLTLQPADRRILLDTHDPKDPNNTMNQADVPLSMAFMKKFVAHSPAGQVFIYSRPSRRTDIDEHNQPTGITFDYSKEWLKTYVESGPANNFNVISRSYVQQFMSAMRDTQHNDAATKNMKPVRLIPAGEAFYNVDQMLKAGKFAGTYVKSMTDFYADGSHPRGDTGSYLVALCFYAAITGHDPRGVAPNSSYMNPAPGVGAAKVQQLIQQAVYDAFKFIGYSGWTTLMPGTTVPPAGNIRVTLFSDLNANHTKESSEPVMAGVKVFLDTNNNGTLDASETYAISDNTGRASFFNRAPGTYHVRVIPPTGTVATTTNPLLATVTASSTQQFQTGLHKTVSASISGQVFGDTNNNGKLDAGEPLLSARTVWLDLDNDGVLDTNERRTTTDASGRFTFTGLSAGTYYVRRVLPTGYHLTTPVPKITLTTGQTLTGIQIGATKT